MRYPRCRYIPECLVQTLPAGRLKTALLQAVGSRSVAHCDIRPHQQAVNLGLGKQPVLLLVTEKPL